LPLIERKRLLRSIVPDRCPFLLYVDHIEGEGERMFQLACERDLEGIVAKHRLSRYATEGDNPAWMKTKNRHYSQIVGRDKLFERKWEAAGAPEIGWDVCDRACMNAEL
jgi:ATP-dependent DNA ligase